MTVHTEQKLQETAVQKMEKTLPLNQYIDCHTFRNKDHDFYYCEAITQSKFNEMQGPSESLLHNSRVDIIVIGLAILAVLIIFRGT